MDNIGWSECHCVCHDSPDGVVKHCIACCEGRCPWCGKYIIGLSEHIKDQHPDMVGKLPNIYGMETVENEGGGFTCFSQ